ncbi:hypothetical protein ALC62_13903, partial [Cyphomyrmex costatus]
NSRVLAGISRVISRSVTRSIQPPWSRSGWKRRIRKGWSKRRQGDEKEGRRGWNPTVYVGKTGNHESRAPARPSPYAIDRL